MNNCVLCGKQGTEQHHVIKRSQATSLKNCKLNLVWLCAECHRTGTYGIHGKNGKENDIKLKAIYYSRMKRLFSKQYYRKEEIKDILGITPNEVTRLLKTTYNVQGKYAKEDILRATMGGKLEIKVTELGGK